MVDMNRVSKFIQESEKMCVLECGERGIKGFKSLVSFKHLQF
jgi:hypothetical protein